MTCVNCGNRRCACIPAEFWRRSDVTTAVLRSDLRRVVELLRTHTALTQEAIALRAELAQSTISRLDTGARQDVQKSRRALENLGAFAHITPNDADAAGPADPTSSAQSQQFIQNLRDPLDDLVLEALSDDVRRLATAYVHQPLPPLIPQLVALRNSSFGHFHAGARPRHARHLLQVAGTTTLLLSHAAQNLGDTHAAATHLAAARRCADHAEDDQLRGWALGSAALFAEWLPRHDRAMQRAADAYTVAPAGATAIRAAAIEARAAARAHDRHRALAALDRLHRAREAAGPPDDLGVTIGGLFDFPPAKQESYQAGVRMRLGDARAAAQHASTAIEMYRTGPEHQRSYGDEALARVDLITAHLHQGDLDAADHELSVLMDLPEDQRIQQLAPAIATLQRALAHPRLKHTQLAHDMRERIRQYTVLDASLKDGTRVALPLSQ